MSEYRNKLHALMDDGLVSPEVLAGMLINWMSEIEAQDFCERGDVSDWFEEEEPEEEVDGVQYRYIIREGTPELFKAEIYLIDSDGDDALEPRWTVDADMFASLTDEVDFYEAEETVDYFLSIACESYADHYLTEHDDVVMTTG